MKNVTPKQLRVFLTSGDAKGIRYAELVNWTGQAFSSPRNLWGDLKEWSAETERPGVYILFGLNADGESLAYIGESENVRGRLLTHQGNPPMDELQEVVFFTSKDDNLSKGHVVFLEHMLYQRAMEAKQIRVKAGKAPSAKALSKPERATMEEFLENVYLVTSALGYDLFEMPSAPSKGSQVFGFSMGKGVQARGVRVADGFMVRKGSCGVVETSTSFAYETLRKRLLDTGAIVAKGEAIEFMQDYTFTSSSLAAAVLAGTSRSGPMSWIDVKTNKTLREIEKAETDSEISKQSLVPSEGES
jgi:hypothetical protein